MILPICNKDGEILGFCYSDKSGVSLDFQNILRYLNNHLDTALFIQEIWPKVQQVCINDCNELAYRIYEMCLKKEIPVCLVGEKWEWFGHTTCTGIYDYPEYTKFYIYAEGTKVTREENPFIAENRWGCLDICLAFLYEIRMKNVASVRYNIEKNGEKREFAHVM